MHRVSSRFYTQDPQEDEDCESGVWCARMYKGNSHLLIPPIPLPPLPREKVEKGESFLRFRLKARTEHTLSQ